MALEVWSEMQFRQKIYTKDAEVDGVIQFVPIAGKSIPFHQGMEIHANGIRMGCIHDYYDESHFSYGKLFVGLTDSTGLISDNIFEYSDDSSCPDWVGLNRFGTFYAKGFSLYDQASKTISKIYSPENNLLNFDHVTTLMYAKNTPIQELSGSKEQFCIQLDSSNGAVTLRNVPNGNNETIFGGYVTLYRPTGMGSSETKLDTLYLDEYKSGSTSIGSAIKKIDEDLAKLGFYHDASPVRYSLGTDSDSNTSASINITRYKSGKMAYIEISPTIEINDPNNRITEENISSIMSSWNTNIDLKLSSKNINIPYPKKEVGGIGVFFASKNNINYGIEVQFSIDTQGVLHKKAAAYAKGGFYKTAGNPKIFVIAWNTIE